MHKPYIDQGTSEAGQPEFSINGLTKTQLQIIESALNTCGNAMAVALAAHLSKTTTAFKEA